MAQPGRRDRLPSMRSANEADEPILLENGWTFWHDNFVPNPPADATPDSHLSNLYTFHSVQEYWQCFNNLPTVDKLKPKCSFHLMKKDIRPIWEDPGNEGGGLWTLRVRKEDTQYAWRELLLAVIGEQFTPVLTGDDEINGLTVSVRQFDNIIALWNSDAKTNKQKELLERIKELLPNVDIRIAFYKGHRDHHSFDLKKAELMKSDTDPASPLFNYKKGTPQMPKRG